MNTMTSFYVVCRARPVSLAYRELGAEWGISLHPAQTSGKQEELV